MTDNVRKSIAAIVILFCWLPQTRYLFPFPQQETATRLETMASDYSSGKDWIHDNVFKNSAEADHLYKKMWQGWILYLFIILFGVISGILTYLKRFQWRSFLILSSILYLYNWYASGSTSKVSLLTSYELKIKTSKVSGAYLTFFYKDLLLPITFLTISIIVIVAFLRTKLGHYKT